MWGEPWGDFSMQLDRSPRHVAGATNIAKISCGAFHTLALTWCGHLAGMPGCKLRMLPSVPAEHLWRLQLLLMCSLRCPSPLCGGAAWALRWPLRRVHVGC